MRSDKFSERLFALCKSKNLKEKEFAEKVNISANAATNYLKKGRIPEADILIRISIFFKKSIDWLLSDVIDDISAHIEAKNPPGSMISDVRVERHSENFEKAVTELFSLIETPDMASKFAQALVCVLERDPERFYNHFYSPIIDDCYMLKRIITKNRRKNLRILN